MSKRANDKGQYEDRPSPVAERLVALAGALAVLYVAGFMFYQAWWGDDSPPDIEIAIVRIVPVHGEYLVEIAISNRGGNTAASTTITGKLMPAGISEGVASVAEEKDSGKGVTRHDEAPRALETAEVTVDYVPAHSRVQAGLYFKHEPAPERLILSATGYVRP